MSPHLKSGFSDRARDSGRQMSTSATPVSRQSGARDRSAHVISDSGNIRKYPQHHLQVDLRLAYKSQLSNKENDNGFNLNVFDNNDQHSTSGGSATNSAGTPTSVYMPSSVALSRDMSDISGISGGTNSKGSSSQNVIQGQILDPKSLTRPWKQAYTLSNIPPECHRNAPMSDRTGHEVVGEDGENTIKKSPSIWVADNDVVEIFDDLESSLGLDRFQIMRGKHNRIPIMILLMDPSKQTYELMQIWVDRAIDSIRDLTQVLQHKLPVRWKQAYDGLFQVRGHRFTQLINIIRLSKYDVQPHEILVAKPWSMAAKVAIAIAGSAIRHLTRIGVITRDVSDDSESSGKDRSRQIRRQQAARNNEDALILLSKRAKDRAYFPEGILNHHHAIQFITFSPPFESPNDTDSARCPATQASANFSSPHKSSKISALDSRCNVHSSLFGSDSNGKRNAGLLTQGIRRVIAGPQSRRRKPTYSFDRSRARNSNSSRNNNKETLKLTLPGDSEGSRTSKENSKSDDKKGHKNKKPNNIQQYVDDESCGPVGCFSKFNCLRNLNGDSATKTREGRLCANATVKPSPQTSMTSFSEEEEKRWLSYSMKPIDEDQSLATGSVVSMSAPLLSSILSQSIDINKI